MPAITAPASPNRILIVEDAPANILALSTILRDHGYETFVATNGRKALEALEKVQPDLVLLDVMMPEMDGYEACRRIKALPGGQDLPIIFLTGKTEAEDIVRGFELGAVDYVSKPFNAAELLARVRTHLTISRLNKENLRLLLNVLPAPIAEQLKQRSGVIAERIEDVSVLFADIAGFTPLSAKLPAEELVSLLDRIFTHFDGLVDKHGLEKIKTIGDAYMAAGGLLEARADHVDGAVRLGLEMQGALAHVVPDAPGLQVRVGVHVGSVVAGVIGTRKFIYDIWGDTVNTASRLESHGVPGRVQVSEEVHQRVHGWCRCEPRGMVDLKGKGLTNVFLAVGP